MALPPEQVLAPLWKVPLPELSVERKIGQAKPPTELPPGIVFSPRTSSSPCSFQNDFLRRHLLLRISAAAAPARLMSFSKATLRTKKGRIGIVRCPAPRYARIGRQLGAEKKAITLGCSALNSFQFNLQSSHRHTTPAETRSAFCHSSISHDLGINPTVTSPISTGYIILHHHTLVKHIAPSVVFCPGLWYSL